MAETRRQVLRHTLAAGGLWAAGGAAAAPARAAAPLVLVHGAWHGGWCWQRVVPLLRRQGLTVHTPTLTGLGERHHLGRPDTDVATHIADLVAHVEALELERIVLVGHSYGGYPVTGAARRLGARVAHLVYLDALIPAAGRPFTDLWPADRREALIAATEKTLVDGWRFPPPPPSVFDVPPADREATAWLQRRLTDMPWGCLRNPFPDDAELDAQGPPRRTFVLCEASTVEGPRQALRVARQRGMHIERLAAGHDAMVTAPQAVARLLARWAREA